MFNLHTPQELELMLDSELYDYAESLEMDNYPPVHSQLIEAILNEHKLIALNFCNGEEARLKEQVKNKELTIVEFHKKMIVYTNQWLPFVTA